MTLKLATVVIINLPLVVRISDHWSDDTTIRQIRSQAIDAAAQQLSDFRLKNENISVGQPQVTEVRLGARVAESDTVENGD